MSPAQAASLENYYFESFDADYYLSRDEEGVPHLKVVENFKIVFPDYNQNKGICRDIPFTNNGGKNVTLKDLNDKNIKVLRNGTVEPIYSIERLNGYYEVCTGDETYILGKQDFTFEYEFTKVITEFETQELYWDTNGNDWQQTFGSVTARIHFAEDIKDAYLDKHSCYVGRYGAKGLERCEYSKTADGVEFKSVDLKSHENLTFDLEFMPGTFTIPKRKPSYILYIVLGVIIILAILLIRIPIKKYYKNKPKIDFYKGYFVKPEYQPHSEYSLAELTEIFIGKKRELKVALLLELVVNKKIELIRDPEKKKKWKIRVNDVTSISSEAATMLEILNNGEVVETGSIIDVKTHVASSKLISLGKHFKNIILDKLKSHNLVEGKYVVGSSTTASGIFSTIFAYGFIAVTFGAPIVMMALALLEDLDEKLTFYDKELLLKTEFPIIVAVIFGIVFLVYEVVDAKTKNFVHRSRQGLQASRYMDGLKLYIDMAEKDRLAFLQSVDGADMSATGIVKLYEKLLPYASVFGLEKSWMNELERYYKLDETIQPDWYRSGLSTSDVLAISRLTSNYVSSSSTPVSSGGGSSSGFSGGGGGGFSGGGGGGGGGHGR